jgi:hypothetical protein
MAEFLQQKQSIIKLYASFMAGTMAAAAIYAGLQNLDSVTVGEPFWQTVNRSSALKPRPRRLHRPERAAAIHPPQFAPLQGRIYARCSG